MDPSKWNQTSDAATFVPWGNREWFRNPYSRNLLFEATQRSLEPPASSQLREEKSWKFRPNSTTGALEKVEFTSIPDQLDDLLSSIREGASKPAILPKTAKFHVIDHSGNLVHINEAIKSAIEQGEYVPLPWKAMIKNLFVILTSELRATSRLPVPRGATRSTPNKAARAPRFTRPPSRLQKRSLRQKEPDGSDISSAQQLESQNRSNGSPGIRQEQLGASEPGSRGDIKSQSSKEPSPKSHPKGSTVPQRSGKSKTTTRTHRTKLSIRDPFGKVDKDAGIGQGASASQEVASKASHESRFVATLMDASQKP